VTSASLAEWLALLEARHPTEIDLGLERVAAVWATILQRRQQQGSPVILPTAITVAGTNGKGSTLVSMQSILLAHGYKVGLFTSPHFLHYNERICVQGEPADDQTIVRVFEEIERARGDTSLTYFEFGTLAALLVFIDAGLDVMLLEVGLGGRLDAINIIDADVAVVASIALDHQAWLGDTRELIAAEKLGIARPGRPLVVAEADHPQGFKTMIAATGAQCFAIGSEFNLQSQGDRFDLTVRTVAGESLAFSQLPALGLLPGNKAAAIQALVCGGFELDSQTVTQALETVTLTGRHQQLLVGGRRVILDVAHNPAAAEILASTLLRDATSSFTSGRYLAVASALNDKDWGGIVRPLSEIFDHWWIAEISDSERATKAQTLLEVLYNAGLSGTLCESVAEAFKCALAEASEDDTIVVFGSFHTVSAVLNMQSGFGGSVK
jgi:dihydrofolate synthase/folylpolyglutamate synthase